MTALTEGSLRPIIREAEESRIRFIGLPNRGNSPGPRHRCYCASSQGFARWYSGFDLMVSICDLGSLGLTIEDIALP